MALHEGCNQGKNVMSRNRIQLTARVQESLMQGLNPILDSHKPPFLSTLEFTRIDFGRSYPTFGGVRIHPSSIGDCAITLDAEILYAASEDQSAEVKIVSNVGMAAKIKLKDLSISGTLRVSLSPLCMEWPCFSAISLSFIRKPTVGFSLTAAKVNITSVPFASEW